MRLFFLLFSLFILSGCMDTVEMPSSTEEKSTTQIQSNKTEAQEAREEYKKLQAQREKE